MNIQSMIARRLSTILLIFFVIAFTACSSKEGESNELLSIGDFVEILQSAGATVSREDMIERVPMEVLGQVLRVDNSQIEVFEYSTLEERQALSDSISPDGGTIAGSSSPWSGSPTIWVAGRLIIVYEGYQGGTVLLISGLVGDPLTYSPPERDEPYPPAIVEAIGFLAMQLEIDPGAVQVIQFEEAEWPDSCLGASKPDEICALVITSGWKITLFANDTLYGLRTDQIGEQIRVR